MLSHYDYSTCFEFTSLDNGWGILSDHGSIYEHNGVPLLLVDRQMAPVRNYAIQSTGSSIVYMPTRDCLGNKTTQSQQRTRNVVWLCVITKGDILPWSQPSWIRQWILVINLNGTNGSRRSRLTEIRTHVTQSLSECLCVVTH